jgi:hypothetical protein
MNIYQDLAFRAFAHQSWYELKLLLTTLSVKEINELKSDLIRWTGNKSEVERRLKCGK